MHTELVERQRWLTERQFLRALSLCMLLPGPEAMQLAAYAGWRLRGIPGGLITGGLFVLPGACVIALLAAAYTVWGDLPLVQAAFFGIKACVLFIAGIMRRIMWWCRCAGIFHMIGWLVSWRISWAVLLSRRKRPVIRSKANSVRRA